MKTRPSVIIFSMIVLLTIIYMSSCSNKFPDPTDHKTYSDTKPFLKDGNFPYFTYIEEVVEELVYNNKFSSVKLNRPQALAVVKRNITSKKTLQDYIPGEYYLYELVDTGFHLVLGTEGNIFTLSNLASISRINETWQILTGTRAASGKITLTSADMTIQLYADVRIDTIYDADTVSVADSDLNPGVFDDEISGTITSNPADTLYITSDTIVYNDTLWIEHIYTFTDTLESYLDTLYTVQSEQFNTLLLNVENGNLFDIGKAVIDPGVDNQYAPYYGKDVFDYDAVNELVYFELSNDEIGKLDLNSLNLEVINLPYSFERPLELKWAMLEDGNIFAHMGNKNALYIPGVGVRTKTNIDYWEYFPFQSLHWRNSENQRMMLMLHMETSKIFLPQLRNDSIIFTDHPFVFQALGIDFPQYEKELFGQLRSIWAGNEKWSVSLEYLFTFNEETNTMKVIRANDENILTNGNGRVYRITETKIELIDFENFRFQEICDLTFLEMDIHEVRVNMEGNIVITGFRYFDLTDVVLEFDGETGELLNEWEESNAPVDIEVLQLVPVFG